MAKIESAIYGTSHHNQTIAIRLGAVITEIEVDRGKSFLAQITELWGQLRRNFAPTAGSKGTD
jgi:hypothetical protein